MYTPRSDNGKGFAMKSGRIVLIISLLAGLLLTHPAQSGAATVMELYGTFHSMGVIVTLTTEEDPDQDSAVLLSYRVAGSSSYRQGLPLSRVSAGRFVGSLFRLSPGTSYDVRVTFSDPDGAPLNGVIVNGSSATRAEIALPSPNKSYHVTPTGSGTTCSAASPCSLTTALNQAQGGQEILLRGGVYYQGELSLPRSGSAGAPTVIRGYPGETAVMDGADPATFTWTAQGGGVYRAIVNAADPHLVMADGQRLYPYQSLADLQVLVWGIPGFFASGTTLYVRLAGNADPSTRAMRVSRFNTAFTIERDFSVLADLTFHHYGLGEYGRPLYFNNASDNLVKGCTFAVNNLGIGLKRDSHRNVFQDNTFYDTDFDWPWTAVKEGRALETGGIRMYDPMTGRGTVIRRNTFHDYFDGFGVCPDATAGVTSETDVSESLVYNAGDDGMETDGQCSNVRIWQNTLAWWEGFSDRHLNTLVELRSTTGQELHGINAAPGFFAATSGTTTILTLDAELKESLNMDKGKEIAISGGWNTAYSARTGIPTTLAGLLAIGSGSLTIDGLAIK
jgi:hypothetical protein